MALTRTLLTLSLGVALGILLAIGGAIHGDEQESPGIARPSGVEASVSAATYLRDVNALLQRYDLARKNGIRLLTQRDSDPLLGATADWRQSFGRVVQEHGNIEAQVQSLVPPPNAGAVQQCLIDGFRLTATGEELLSEAFGADGHQAYFLSAHGNWDLSLGDRGVARCRTLLAALLE